MIAAMSAQRSTSVAKPHRKKRRRTHVPALPTAGGGIARLAYEQAKKAGIDAGDLLKRAKLTVPQIADARLRLPVKSQIEFLNLVADALQNEFLGLRLAQNVDLRELGLLYYVLASSQTLADALQRVARYSTMSNEGVRLSYRRHRSPSIAFRYSGISRARDHHQMEFFVAILLRICRQLTGRRLVPDSVRFMHRRKELSPDLKSFFGCAVTFGSDADEVVYGSKSGDLPVVSADPFLNSVLIKYCEEAVSRRRSQSSDWRLNVENAMAELLPHGQARAPEVCRRLGVSRRTLARRLASEGLTFSAVLDALRQDLAKRYLQEAELPMSEVAWLLGFRQTSSFNHAFKRWTGKAPSRLRARSGAANDRRPVR
jgi:AraC-like DNA-binding protein